MFGPLDSTSAGGSVGNPAKMISRQPEYEFDSHPANRTATLMNKFLAVNCAHVESVLRFRCSVLCSWSGISTSNSKVPCTVTTDIAGASMTSNTTHVSVEKAIYNDVYNSWHVCMNGKMGKVEAYNLWHVCMNGRKEK